MHLALLGLVGLGFFETPAWMVSVGPAAANTSLYPVSGLPQLPQRDATSIEVFFLVVLVIDALCSVGAQGWNIVRKNKLSVGYLAVLALAVVEAGFAMVVGLESTVGRFAPFLRLFLLTLQSRVLQSQMWIVWRTLPQVGGILVCVVACLFIFGEAYIILYGGAVNSPLGGLGSAVWQLFICLTSANFPDVMMPEYSTNRATILFYVAFLFVAHLFLLNLVLAVVVKAHSDSVAATAKASQLFQERALRAGFACLLQSVAVRDTDNPTPPSTLPLEAVLAMFKELNLYRDIAHIDRTRAQLLFAALDTSGDSAVDEAEFLGLCEILRIRFERVPRVSWVEVVAPTFAKSEGWKRVCVFVRSPRFDYIVDTLLVLAGALLVIEQQVVIDRMHDFDSRPDSPWNILELTLSAAFLLEMAVKVAALGLHTYLQSFKNAFDAFSTIATFATVIIVYVPNAISDARIIRCVLLLRLMRLLRLLSWSPQMRFVVSTFLAALPDAYRLLQVLCAFLYFFSQLGVGLFGGLINKDPNRPEHAQLEGSDFGSANYYANNFNDLASGVVTCFELMIVNNWFVLCDGFVAVTSVWARVFFVGFYVTGPLLLLNIAVAAVMDAFLLISEGAETSSGADGADDPQSERQHFRARLEGASAVIDASSVSGTSTGVSGLYRAYISNAVARSQHRDMLRNWLLDVNDSGA